MTDHAQATWDYIEHILVEECGLLPDQGLATERPNLINAIRSTTFVVPNQAVVTAAIEFLSSSEGLHKIRVNGKMMDRKAVSKALTGVSAPDQDVQSRLTHHALARLFKACKTQVDLQPSIDHAESILRGDWKNTAQPSPSVAVKDGQGGAA